MNLNPERAREHKNNTTYNIKRIKYVDLFITFTCG